MPEVIEVKRHIAFPSLLLMIAHADIKYVSGSVEAACGLGLADAVVDLVETGTTMRAAGLEVVSDICASQSLLIVSKQCRHSELVEVITRRIQVRQHVEYRSSHSSN